MTTHCRLHPIPLSALPDGVRGILSFVEELAELHVNVELNKKVPSLADKSKMICIAQGYCEAERYMTLFDIGTGGGCTDLDTRRGWERRMFGPIYDGFDAQRPRYGNINLMAKLRGDKVASHYGKSYLVMKDHVRKRCTVTSRDSSRPKAVLGTLKHFAHVLMDTVEQCGSKRRRFLRLLHKLVHWSGEKVFPNIGMDLKE